MLRCVIAAVVLLASPVRAFEAERNYLVERQNRFERISAWPDRNIGGAKYRDVQGVFAWSVYSDTLEALRFFCATSPSGGKTIVFSLSYYEIGPPLPSKDGKSKVTKMNTAPHPEYKNPAKSQIERLKADYQNNFLDSNQISIADVLKEKYDFQALLPSEVSDEGKFLILKYTHRDGTYVGLPLKKSTDSKGSEEFYGEMPPRMLSSIADKGWTNIFVVSPFGSSKIYFKIAAEQVSRACGSSEF